MSRDGTSPPLVSIIVPSFNQGRFLRQTLDSVLAQDHRPLEIVVVDGASSDETLGLLAEYGGRYAELTWLSEPDEGPADAVNKGLGLITGSIAGIQSSDDLYKPGAISAAVSTFREHPEAGIVYGDAEVIDENGRHLFGPTSYLPYSLNRYLCGSSFILQSSAFFRPDLARSAGGWRHDFFVADVDLWMRMVFRAPAVKIDAVLSAFRRHEAQRDKQTAAILTGHRRLVDSLPELQRAPWRSRLAARAGALMLVQHYNPSGSRWLQWSDMWRALILYPPSLRAVHHARMLLPPIPTIRAIRARMARREV